MKVKELIEQLQKLPENNEICITCMSDNFCISNFEVHSPYEEQAQEIILNCYIDNYRTEEECSGK